MGLNDVYTYVPWNFHETSFEGRDHNFSAERDIRKFMHLVEDRGMFLLLRIGPYVCAELDLDGNPARLLQDPDVKLRTYDETYMDKVLA